VSSGPRTALALFAKDLRLDLRSGDRLGHMAVFAAMLVALLSITLPQSGPQTAAWLPALAWIVFLLTSLLGLSRSFQSEVEQGALANLAQVPCDRGWVFLGKTMANFVTLVGVQVLTALLFEIFLDVSWETAPLVCAGVGLLGALGLSALGSLLAAMAVAARFREFLLPVLLFPLVLPVLVIASRATGAALAGEAVDPSWWGALALYDWVVLLVGYFVFDYVLEE
jgi:heme exporter protein B